MRIIAGDVKLLEFLLMFVCLFVLLIEIANNWEQRRCRLWNQKQNSWPIQSMCRASV